MVVSRVVVSHARDKERELRENHSVRSDNVCNGYSVFVPQD